MWNFVCQLSGGGGILELLPKPCNALEDEASCKPPLLYYYSLCFCILGLLGRLEEFAAL